MVLNQNDPAKENQANGTTILETGVEAKLPEPIEEKVIENSGSCSGVSDNINKRASKS